MENSNSKIQGGPPINPLNPLFQSPQSPVERREKIVAGSSTMLIQNGSRVGDENLVIQLTEVLYDC